MTDIERQLLRIVLSEVVYPARRWEIITAADTYGADGGTRQRLRRLPLRNRPFRDLQDIVDALDAIRRTRQ
ncbi:MAG TPA: DUF2795 domain-containing protein [Pseudonocardiaceae bacterium]|nr:DUF2795 domain-containing protein [Pseudonocardiaceae bacterium]